uniref:Putative dipeptidase n=1 Tax=Streptomyces sp. FR1 TaxID=349971 RepID=V9Z4X7_9ACTN|nr:Putative dipeptidase [Streptomyces sp. FR1]
MSASSIVLMSDRRVAAIPVQERGEVLLDARAHGLMVDDRKQDAAGAWAHVRQGVLTRLQQAQSLLPGGVQLLFIEGYRPPSLQRRYFEEYSDSPAPTRTGRPPSSGRPPAASCHRRRSRRTPPARPST